MDRAAVPSAANRRRRTPRPSMKWQKTRSPFAFSSPRPLRLTLYSRRGASSDGDRFATLRRKMGVTAVGMPLVKIGKAAELLGVSVQTLRKWEDSGELVPDRRGEGGVRYYDMGKILGRLKFHWRRQKEPPRPRIEAVRIVDMSASNSWAEFAALFRNA